MNGAPRRLDSSFSLHTSSLILGCLTGLEPATSGSTVQCSAIKLQAPYCPWVRGADDSIMDEPAGQDKRRFRWMPAAASAPQPPGSDPTQTACGWPSPSTSPGRWLTRPAP